MDAESQMKEPEEALRIVRRILSPNIAPERITIGEGRSYKPIILDGNSWKTICRLYFNGTKYIGIISPRRVETKKRIQSADDIHLFADDFVVIVKKYG